MLIREYSYETICWELGCPNWTLLGLEAELITVEGRPQLLMDVPFSRVAERWRAFEVAMEPQLLWWRESMSHEMGLQGLGGNVN